jgi:hypothetical protein
LKVLALDHDFCSIHTEPDADVEVDGARLGPIPSPPRAGRALTKEPWLTLGLFSVCANPPTTRANLSSDTLNAARLVAALAAARRILIGSSKAKTIFCASRSASRMTRSRPDRTCTRDQPSDPRVAKNADAVPRENPRCLPPRYRRPSPNSYTNK